MFTRKESIVLSGLKGHQIDYLISVGILNPPTKISHKKILFSWGQIVEMRFIAKIRETITLQKIRDAKKYLDKINFDCEFLANRKIVVGHDGTLYLKKENEDILETISGKNKGQFALTQVILCNEVIKDLKQNRSTNILDFEKKLEESNVPNVRKLIKAS